jgi:serine/threonine-protein kinase
MQPQAAHPATIGRFVVESVLGSGAMGTVYKATDPTLKRTVAIKTVRPGLDNPELLERLLREAQACARLHHKNVVTIYEAGQIEGSVYIAMEYLVGDSLATVLSHGTLPFEQALQILVQVLDALEHVHRAGIVHRDIKPGNIYCEADGSIKLVDFGLARVQQADAITMTGMFMATPGYASPEQFRGDTVDFRTDLYSTGVVAYEMISGHRPFAGDLSSLLYKVVHEPPPPMDVVSSRMYPEVERIVQKALAKSPHERHQSAAAMRGELRAVAVGSTAGSAVAVARAVNDPTDERTTPAPGRSTTRTRGAGSAMLAVAAAAILLLMALGWFVAGRPGAGKDTAGAPRDHDILLPKTTEPKRSPSIGPSQDPQVASQPPPQNGGASSTGTAARSAASAAAGKDAGAAPNGPDAARCARLVERASLGEVLNAADRTFLVNNCGSAR